MAGTVMAEDPCITNVIITKFQNDTYVYFNIDECFTEDMEEAINSGISTTFVFIIELKKSQFFWFDPTITKKTFTHTITYDSLTDEYTVYREEGRASPLVYDTYEEAVLAMGQVRFYPLTTMNVLEKGERYQVRIRSRLDKMEVPESIRYVLFFANLWEFDTGWYVEEFIY
ncbi:MAG: DUF4390 domain-containing protein [Deltaproteobacteria bacterium]|nr:DUF4390 domain-containing protein [Candidatus Zymogenaceae bacterium]